MIVAGSLTTGSLTNWGTLGGTGIIHAPVINYGTISPGNSIGALTVDGSVTFQPGSILFAELSENGESDLLKVTGSAVINGGIIKASVSRNALSQKLTWQVLSADGGMTGDFDGLECDTCTAVMVLRMACTNEGVSLEAERKPYADFGQTPNQRSVGHGLDAVANLAQGMGDAMATLLYNVNWEYSADQIQDLLAACNPGDVHRLHRSLAGGRRPLRPGPGPPAGRTTPAPGVRTGAGPGG